MKNFNLKKILDSTHDAIIAIDESEKIILFNQSAKKLMKIINKEVNGRPIKEIIPDSRLPFVLRSGQAEINNKMELSGITIIANRMPIFDDHGKIRGVVSVFRDITEIEDLIEEITKLKEIRIMLESIIDSTQDAISVANEKGINIMVNHAYTQLSGLKKEEIIGKSVTVDISEGESIHLKVLKTKAPVKNARLKLAPFNKDIIVNAAPIIVDDRLKGSVAVIHDVTEIQRLTKELNAFKEIFRKITGKYTFKDIIGNDRQMQLAVEKAKKAAITPATVLLIGKSGTGKELFAHAIHNESSKKYRNLIRINCAAIPEALLESELFGYEEGAFTGAKKGGKIGLFEQANGGTIFLDEIGKMSLNTQSKFLRVLQEKEIMRIGGEETIKIDARVIAATNEDLEELVKKGLFREDLYYRLNVIPIFIPPLKHRKNDISLLAKNIINKFNIEYGRFVRDISEEALEIMSHMEWKGNVRELENFIGRAMIDMTIDEDVINKKHLPISKATGVATVDANLYTPTTIDEAKPLSEVLSIVEKEYIYETLKKNENNKTKTAQQLGLSIRNLYYKIEKYGLDTLSH